MMGEHHEWKSFDELSKAYGKLFNLLAYEKDDAVRKHLHDVVGYSWDYLVNPHLFGDTDD